MLLHTVCLLMLQFWSPFKREKKNDWNFPKENSPHKIPMFAELNSSPNLTKNKSTRLHVKRTFKNLQEVLMNKTATADWLTGLGQALASGPWVARPGIKQIFKAGAVKKAASGQGWPCSQMLMICTTMAFCMWRQVRKCVESLWKFSEAKEFKFSLLWSQSQKTQQTQDGLLTLTEKLCLPNANPTSQRNFLFSHFPLLLMYSLLPAPLNWIIHPCVLLGRGSTEHTLHVHPAEESNPQSQSRSWDSRAKR